MAPIAAAPPAVPKPSKRFDDAMCRHAPAMPAMSLLSASRAATSQGLTGPLAQYDRHIRRMRAGYRRRRDALVAALAGFDVGISGLPAGLHLLLALPDGAEHALRRAGQAGVALAGPSRLRHPLAAPDTPHRDGIVVNFGAPAEHAFAAAVEALRGVLGATGLAAQRDARRVTDPRSYVILASVRSHSSRARSGS